MPFTSQRDSFANYRLPVAGKPKTIARNTFRFTRGDGAMVTRLHFTDILVEYPDGSFMVTTNGWKTKTTKERLDTYLPKGWRVVSRKAIWYVVHEGKSVPFVDGMILPRDFQPGKDDAAVKEQLALKKRIDAFVNRTMPNGKPLPVPSSGDCWFCSMFAAEKPVNSQKLGSLLAPQNPADQDADHLLSHVEEGYMHGSLIINAMRFAGYNDRAISFGLQFADHARERRAVKRYLGRKLGLASH